jgi:hypothetical protein
MDIFSTGYSATTMLASVVSGAQATFASIGPIFTWVGGVLIAFIVARYVLGLLKHVGKVTK